MSEKTPEAKEDPIYRAIIGYHNEAKDAKFNRMQINKGNWDCYHLKQDYSHKQEGQSKEFLAKQTTAVEQITSFLQQGLVDLSKWYSIENEDGVKEPLIEPEEVEKLLGRQLAKNSFPSYVADSMKSGLLAALMITKVGGILVEKVKFRVEVGSEGKKKLIKQTKKVWQLQLSLVRQEDWYPDPTGRGLYNQEVVEMDFHELLQLSKEKPDEFNPAVVKDLSPNADFLQETNKSRETDQTTPMGSTRKKIRFIEHWGTICDPSSGEVLHSNCVARTTEEGQIITSPRPNPLWHGEDPYVSAAIVRVPNSVWHRALMDAPTTHNRAINELYNLMLDAGIMAVYGIRQLREDWLEDPSQVSNGVSPGVTLMVNSSCPPNAKVMERVDTGTMDFMQAVQMFQITDREFQASALTNDTRLGNLPQRAVKATEIVASNQSITGIFNGTVKLIEDNYIAKILSKAWLTCAQHLNDWDLDEVKALLGDERASLLANMAPEDRFAGTAMGQKYRVYGLSTTLNKIQDFKKLSTFLQVVGTNPIFAQEFQRTYSLNKFLGEIVKSLDIDDHKIKADEKELADRQREQAIIQRFMAQQAAKGGDQASQIPEMGGMAESTGVDIPRSAMNEGMTTPQ